MTPADGTGAQLRMALSSGRRSAQDGDGYADYDYRWDHRHGDQDPPGDRVAEVQGDAAAVLGDEDAERIAQREFVRADLDRQFPHRRNAEKQVVGRIQQRRPGACAEQRIAFDEPKEGVRIEEELHASRPSQNASGSGAWPNASSSESLSRM